MKSSKPHIIFIFISILCLSSCVVHNREVKSEKKINIEEVSQITKNNNLATSFIKYDFYTKENIVKLFGEPVKTELKDGDTEVLHYQVSRVAPMSTLQIIIPINYISGTSYYGYSFELKNNKLENINYEIVEGKTVGVSILPPKIFDNVYSRDMNLFDSNECALRLEKMSEQFKSMIPEYTDIEKTCYSNQLFDSNMLRYQAFNKKEYNNGYTKIVDTSIRTYNRNIFNPTRPFLEKVYKQSVDNIDKDRLTDVTIKESNFKTKHLDCKIFQKTGKDYKAVNKGENKYLILDNFGALCFTKYPNIIFDIQNSNRYPQSISENVNTYNELIEIIKKVEID